MVELWYAILVLMLALYVVLDGCTIGAGMLHFAVGRSEADRRTVLSAIGPFWLWNEVWLVAAGGVATLAFPAIVGFTFSGLYLAVMMLVWALIGRGVAIELLGHIRDRLWLSFWDSAVASCSVLLAVLVGLVLGNVIRGVPITPDGGFILPLFTNFRVRGQVGILDWYTVSVAAFFSVCLAAHGASFLVLRTRGSVNLRAHAIASRLWWVALFCLPVLTVMTWYVRPELVAGIASRPAAWAFVTAIFFGVWAITARFGAHAEMKSFLRGCLALLGLMGSAAIGVYPVFLKSTLGDSNSFTIADGGASDSSLRLGLVWWPVALTMTMGYGRFLARNFGSKVGDPQSIEQAFSFGNYD